MSSNPFSLHNFYKIHHKQLSCLVFPEHLTTFYILKRIIFCLMIKNGIGTELARSYSCDKNIMEECGGK